jgi:Arc/MetJ family transcription regulator
VYIELRQRGEEMIRTNVVLDENLVKTGLKITGIKTQRALLDYALRELLRHEDQKKLLKLRGKISWQGDLNTSRQSRVN